MRSADKLEIVVGEELCGHLGSKKPAGPAGRHSPAVHLLRVRPDQVTECSLVRDLLVPLDQPDLIQGPDLRGEATVDTEDLTVDEGGHSEKVKHFATIFPDIAVPVLVLTLVIEPVYLQENTIKILQAQLSSAPTCVICLDSWLPLRSVTRSGQRALKTNSLVRVSRL